MGGNLLWKDGDMTFGIVVGSGMLRGAGGRVVSAGGEEFGLQWALGLEWGWLQKAIFDSLLF